MRIAFLGATSQIARDLALALCAQGGHQLTLFSRRSPDVSRWLEASGFAGQHEVAAFSALGTHAPFDALLNFVGVGNPAQALAMGAAIFDVTLQYDTLALDYVRAHPSCRYVFLSSGAAYGGTFDAPASRETQATVPFNQLQPQDWYAAAKLHAECRHRALRELPIIDIRVFNYFSHTQDIEGRFLVTDIVRSIRDGAVLQTSPAPVVRDYIHPSDFARLVGALLASAPANDVVDAYSLAPVTKLELLAAMQQRFGLRFEAGTTAAAVNATGLKPHYYSLDRRAADFGYVPRFTSLESVVAEAEKMLAR